jgi:hypothetical protein
VRRGGGLLREARTAAARRVGAPSFRDGEDGISSEDPHAFDRDDRGWQFAVAMQRVNEGDGAADVAGGCRRGHVFGCVVHGVYKGEGAF